MGEDIPHKVIYVNLPCSVRGFVVNNCGFYTIVLNSRLSMEENRKTYKHELEHIINDDFNKFDAIDIIEKIRHCNLKVAL